MFSSPQVYGVKHKNEAVRMESRSGGFFTAISDYVLDKQGIVYGVCLEGNTKAYHSRATTKIERDKMRGSKYIQSEIGNCYHQVKKDLKTGCLVLFSGTSCQIAALKSFLRIDYSNLILLDIICHGVPSQKVWSDFLEWAEKKHNAECIGVNFRNKKKFGWAAHKETLQFKSCSGDIKTFDSEIFKHMFCAHYIIRPSCYKCPYKDITHPADITIADFWKVDSALPGFNDNKGVSLVLVNNKKGEEIFNAIKKDLIYQPSTIEKCMMSTMQKPFPKPEDRDEFWRLYYKNEFQFIAKRYGKYGLINGIKQHLDTLKRKISRRIRGK